MADYTFFFNPMSRAQIARWALHEVAADYDPVFVPWEDKPAALLVANPMGKLPTLIHHAGPGDNRVVTEAAAICHYLAVRHYIDGPEDGGELLPRQDEIADYFRWMFFAAGPVEAAVTAQSVGWTPTEEQQAMVGFGSLERVIDTLDGWLSARPYVCGPRFTMADVYVGSQVDWGLAFGTMPRHDSLVAYAERLQARAAYQEAKAIDTRLIAEMQGDGG